MHEVSSAYRPVCQETELNAQTKHCSAKLEKTRPQKWSMAMGRVRH